MKRTQPEQQISIRFPVNVLERMRELALTHDRSFNGEVVWALREYIRRQPKHRKEVSDENPNGL